MAVQVNIHDTLGVLFIVTIVTSALYGVGVIQAWFYYRNYNNKDRWYVRTLVGVVLFCDTAQMAMLSAAVYDYSVTKHDDPLALTKLDVGKNILTQLFFSGAIALLVQQFYCYRIWILSKNWIITAFVSAFSWASLILLYVYTIETINFPSLAALVEKKTLCTVLNSFGAVTDVVISMAMIYCLQTSKTGFKSTTGMINRLIAFTFSAGIPTSVCALLDVASLNSALGDTFVYMGWFLLMGRFYTNSLLVMLNSREYIREGSSSSANDSIPLNTTTSTARFQTPHAAWEPYSIDLQGERTKTAAPEEKSTRSTLVKSGVSTV
ncbi:hypothetical protein D9758_007689 [Tetrapyrgos nigripes]|uniref:DUF6534 domain-containing protein n=1 Tax=Tetrapyrgos nigripes TaxID=182062 RepID=A0A8H5G598_9AGAR|nr:hypothetical protein D9758_007689 [Tetrapyrgos nigripes]